MDLRKEIRDAQKNLNKLSNDELRSIMQYSSVNTEEMTKENDALRAFKRVLEDHYHGIYGNRTVKDNEDDIKTVRTALEANQSLHETIESQKQTFDALVNKYEKLEKECREYENAQEVGMFKCDLCEDNPELCAETPTRHCGVYWDNDTGQHDIREDER